MKRQSGRHLNAEYYVEIFSLPGKKLFSPAEIVHRVHNKNTDPESFTRMFNALYRFADRNGLKETPDNCVRHPDGSPATVNGMRQLLPGERRPKWYGRTWRKQFYDDDLFQFRQQYQTKLVRTFQQIALQKQQEGHAPIQVDDGQIHLVTMPKKELRMPKTKIKWLLIAIVLILFTAASLYNYSFLNEGYQVLRQDGPKAALTYFQNRGESFDNLFGQAWAAFRNGEYEDAEKLGQKVLKSRKDNERVRGFYLLGSLKSQQGEYEEAQEHLQAAEAIYESLGHEAGAYQTRLLQAKLFIDLKDMDNARYYANLAGQNPKAEQDDYFLYIQSQIAFFYNDFETALKFSIQRERVFSGDRSKLADLYSDIGLYYGFVGNLDECFKYTLKAEGIATELEQLTPIMFNKINMYLYLKCSLEDYHDLRLSILAYARANKEERMKELVYFIDKYSCPLIQADSGHPPPPPPDEANPGNTSSPESARVGSGHPPPPPEEAKAGNGHPPPPEEDGEQ